MTLKIPFNGTMQPLLENRVDAVQASAQRFGGFCVWPFSQLQYPVKGLLRLQRESLAGICEMFAAKWLEQHAKGGSIVNWMTAADSGAINTCKVLQLKQYFSIGSVMDKVAVPGSQHSGAFEQASTTEAWLRSRGLIKRRQLTGGLFYPPGAASHPVSQGIRKGGCDSRQNFSEQIARQVIQSNRSYKMITVKGAFLRHAMAAWSDQDVSFFDPNFGEFWFARPQDFIAWLVTFWHLAGYNTATLGLDENYAIQEYGLPGNK